VEDINSIIANPSVIRNILTLRYDPNQKSPLPKKEWNDFITNNEKPSLEFIEKSIKNYFYEKIKNSDKLVSVALSGGVDSTLVVSLLKNTFPDIQINTISVKFAESIDETQNAAELANHLDLNHHTVFLENYLEELPKAISIVKLPLWDLHWYYVAKKAQTLSRYLVSGDGGDELFGGYTFRYSKFLSLINPNSTPQQKVKAYLDCHERDRVPDQEDLFEKKIQFSWKSIYDLFITYFDNQLSPLEQVFLADYNGKLLYNFAIVNSTINNHFNLQSVTPLLSKEMISYAIRLNHKFKYDAAKNLGKISLREILKKFGTEQFVSEQKQGFSVNTINLWKTIGQKLCKEYLLDSRIVKEGWIKKDWITKYVDKTENLDIKYINKFFGLLAFEIWYRLFVTKEMKPDNKL